MTDISRQLRGAASRKNGEYFEELISRACVYYESLGIAVIEKTPEPMRPISKANGKGQFLACYTKQAQPDYKGTEKGGRSVIFEAKHTDNDRIEYNRLNRYHSMGAVCFILVSFGFRHFYRIPWEHRRDMKLIYRRLYIKETELKCYEVPTENGYIKFLDKLSNGKA